MAVEHATGIYEIRNVVNGKRYVGSAVDFANRWRVHAQSLKRGDHHSKPLQRAWSLYGPGAFHFNKLIACEKADLLMYEQIAMDAMKPEYNCAKVAGSMLGYKHSDETRKKLSDAHKGLPSYRKGVAHTDETKAKISDSRKGKGGGPRTPERLAKIASAMRAAKSVLDEEKVRRIRCLNAAGVRHRAVAEEVGCSYWVVADVVQGRCFSWVK